MLLYYRLTGIIALAAGHFTSYNRRRTGHFELYNDLARRVVKSISSTKIIEPNAAIYILDDSTN